jgi:amino acid permease
MIFMIIMGILTVNSSWLYIQAKELIPGKPESIFEIGFMLFQRRSIFAFSSILFSNALGITMVYFMVFGDTVASMVGEWVNHGKD